MQRVGIGIIGTGKISSAYIEAARFFPILEIVAIADLDPAVAQAKADQYGLRAVPLEDIYTDPAVEIVLNLTIPAAHLPVGLRALAAGKHVYSEKPLAITFSDGRTLLDAAEQAGLRLGCAPDTFLGGAHQTARTLLDEGVLGTAVGGTAYFMCPGHERWHPNPAFYYEVGGGPMLDMGPYYITDLVNLFGPVAQVAGLSATPRPTRTITAKERAGEIIPVHVPTHVGGTLLFANGAIVQITMSFDVAGHRHLPLELYGTQASLIVPDPNHFGGQVELLQLGGQWEAIEAALPYGDGTNYRSIGLADMAHALRSDRPHRASGALALHVLEVMEAFDASMREGRHVEISTSPARPEPLSGSLVEGVLAR